MRRASQEALDSLKRRVRGQLGEFFDSAIVLGVVKGVDGLTRPQPFGLCFCPHTESIAPPNGDDFTPDDISEVAEPVRQMLLTAMGDPGNPSAKEFRIITLALWNGMIDVMSTLLEGAVSEIEEDDGSESHLP